VINEKKNFVALNVQAPKHEFESNPKEELEMIDDKKYEEIE